MLRRLRQLDGILRGESTRPTDLSAGRIETPIAGLLPLLVVLAVVAGACVGSYAMIRTGGANYGQLLASAAKLPLLLGLTLVVTFPSLYVLNALLGSQLTVDSALRLLVASVAVIVAVWASMGPIVVFFGVSTTSYPFMVLLNVIVAAVAGLLGLAFLLRTMERLALAGRYTEVPPPPLPKEDDDDDEAPESDGDKEDEQNETPGPAAPEAEPAAPAEQPGALDRLGPSPAKIKVVFRVWVLLFALVGAQMSWVLRPFVGDPEMPFAFLRERSGNFFEAVLRTLQQLLGV